MLQYLDSIGEIPGSDWSSDSVTFSGDIIHLLKVTFDKANALFTFEKPFIAYHIFSRLPLLYLINNFTNYFFSIRIVSAFYQLYAGVNSFLNKEKIPLPTTLATNLLKSLPFYVRYSTLSTTDVSYSFPTNISSRHSDTHS